MIIGVIGKSGSGKSSVCSIFKEEGFFVIDADEVGREVLEAGSDGTEKIAEVFGDDFFNANGSLNRKKLGAYVFGSAERLELLNSVTKPLIEKRISAAVFGHNEVIIEGAVLHTTKIAEICDFLILVKSEKSLFRVMGRDNLSESEARSRLNLQILPEKADIIIENNGDFHDLRNKVTNLIRRLHNDKKAFT
jgi:dephospho-CoA kinase